MNTPRFHVPNAARFRLTATIATSARETARLPTSETAADGATPESGVVASWIELVEALAMRPEPEARECSVCAHIGMRAGAFCAYWGTTLAPLGERAAVSKPRSPSIVFAPRRRGPFELT